MNSYVTAAVAVLILVSSCQHDLFTSAAIQRRRHQPALRDPPQQQPLPPGTLWDGFDYDLVSPLTISLLVTGGGEPVGEIISVGALIEEMLQQQRHPAISPLGQYQHEQRHYDTEEVVAAVAGSVPGPVFTFVKTDPKANFKWGVRHYVQDKRNYH